MLISYVIERPLFFITVISLWAVCIPFKFHAYEFISMYTKLLYSDVLWLYDTNMMGVLNYVNK